jgi:hypothetical protein
MLRPYAFERYQGVSLDKLAAAGIYKLNRAGIECTCEKVVVAIYKLFPEKFSMLSFPEYPDSSRIVTTLRLGCRQSGCVTGNAVSGFSLTEVGRLDAEDTLNKIESGTAVPDRTTAAYRRSRETRLIKETQSSIAFQEYQAGKMPKRFDVCDLLHGSDDTEENILTSNLRTLRRYAEILKLHTEYRELATSVLAFIRYIEKNWKTIMHEG